MAQLLVKDFTDVDLSTFKILSVLAEFKVALRGHGPLCILEHFDTGYSVLQ